MAHSHPSPAPNIVGVHYRVGKKIGEGSFGVIFEGASVLFLHVAPCLLLGGLTYVLLQGPTC